MPGRTSSATNATGHSISQHLLPVLACANCLTTSGCSIRPQRSWASPGSHPIEEAHWQSIEQSALQPMMLPPMPPTICSHCWPTLTLRAFGPLTSPLRSWPRTQPVLSEIHGRMPHLHRPSYHQLCNQQFGTQCGQHLLPVLACATLRSTSGSWSCMEGPTMYMTSTTSSAQQSVFTQRQQAGAACAAFF